MSIGIAGSHRVGKTTLAEAVSRETGLPFVRTSTSDVAKRLGIRPSDDLEFKDRMILQDAILESLNEQWSEVREAFVSDRTPLDFLGYTMADIGVHKANSEIEWKILERYINRCFDVSNRHFAAIFVVQPGIPIVDDPGKVIGSMNRSYMEHLNMLIIGAAGDQRCTSATYRLRRNRLDMQSRVASVTEAWARICARLSSTEAVLH